MSFLADLADERQDTDSMLSILADTQFQRCRSALRKLASYWGGAEFVCRVIDQRSAGLTKGVVHSVEDRQPRPIIVEVSFSPNKNPILKSDLLFIVCFGSASWRVFAFNIDDSSWITYIGGKG